MVATILMIYVQVAMSGPMMNILTTSLVNESGWTVAQITAPIAISTLLGIVVNFVLTTLMTKVSPKTVVVSILVLLAASMLLMGVANSIGSYVLFYISFFVCRLLYAVPKQKRIEFLSGIINI